jgi:CDP-diglyceride synthetase
MAESIGIILSLSTRDYDYILTGLLLINRFLFPCSLIIMNDTAAYICGRLFGRRKFLKLSPKKTMEGFVGACVVTLLFGYKVIPLNDHLTCSINLYHSFLLGLPNLTF